MKKKFLFAVMALLTMASGNIWGQDKYYTPYVVFNDGTLYFLCDEHADLTEITIDGNTIQLTTAVGSGRNCWTGTEVTNSGSDFPMWHYTLKSFHIINRVVIEESFKNAEITSCCKWFDGDEYGNITSLDLSNLNTSKVTNMYAMFDGRRGLTSLDLSNFDTSNVTNMCAMFNVCDNLTSINLSSFNTSNVTDMSYMFMGCSSLPSLNLSHFDTSNVTTMKSMFLACHSLTSLDISSFNTSKVTDMSGMFNIYNTNVLNGYGSLTSLDLSNFDTSNVTNMASMFKGYNLPSLDLSNFNTSNVVNMAYMFKESNLTSLDLSNFDTSNVTTMQEMFYDCNKLESLVLKNFNTSKVTDMQSMFSKCKSLTSLKLGSFDNSNVKYMNSMFSRCESLISLDLSHFNTPNVTNMAGMFNCCFSLSSFDFSNFDTSNVTNMQGMFSYCKNLTSLDLRNFNTSNVETMERMFDNCRSLTLLDLSHFNTSEVSSLDYMFLNCSSLLSLDLSNFDTSNETYVHGMFDGCSSLRLLNLSQATIPNFSSMESSIDNRPLTYVPAGTAVTEGRTNVVVDKDCEHFVIDNNQLLLSVPYSFTANKITINRSFIADNAHTLCLPFALDAKAYGTFYAYEAYDDSSKGVMFNALEGATTTEANKPYLFMPTETLESGIVIDNPTWVAAYTAVTSADGEFIGVYKKKTFTQDEASEGVYYGWAGGEFKRAGEGASVDACRAYLKLPASSANRAPARLSVQFDGSATGISSAVNGADNGSDAPAYNLQGQRVDGSHKGVVIRNGKKVIMK